MTLYMSATHTPARKAGAHRRATWWDTTKERLLTLVTAATTR